MSNGFRGIALATLSLCAAPAQAHSFGKLYTLPVPFWLYGWASAAALLLSFLVLVWFFSQPNQRQTIPVQAGYGDLPRSLRPLLQSLSVLALLTCIVAGVFGAQDAYRNISMTLFWIVFVLGMAYATALVGDIYALANPWQALTSNMAKGRYAYPQKFGHWPALLLYMGFIWSELFAGYTPQSLAGVLLGYTLLNMLAVYLVGARVWFHYGEFFSVIFRLIGKMSPLAYRDAIMNKPAGWRWRAPFAGLLETRPESLSEVIFILFMLSSTAFDGLHETQTWALLFWQDAFALLTPWLGNNIVTAYATLKSLYQLYQTLTLLLSPWLYLLIFAACLWLMKRITASSESLTHLIYRFSYSLLPIVVVYHFTHYFTLVLGQGSQLPNLMTDPLGLGWNLLALSAMNSTRLLFDMSWVWHTQVAAMLFGHIASVYVAHEVARRLYASPKAVWLSQLPLLILMMAFTVFGLWILAQPLGADVLQ